MIRKKIFFYHTLKRTHIGLIEKKGGLRKVSSIISREFNKIYKNLSCRSSFYCINNINYDREDIMATTSNLNSIIYYYTGKTQSAFIDFREFCGFMKKYAEHHVEEESDLVKYLGNPSSVLTAELQELADKHLVALIKSNDKQTIISIPFFTNLYTQQYNEIARNESIPFPVIDDLPKNFPLDALEKRTASQYIGTAMGREGNKSPLLYVLDFEKAIPPLLLPAGVPIRLVVEAAQKKIKRLLRKDQYHDYFLKKLRSTNSAKEISIKNFYTHFVDEPGFKYSEFSDGDDYYICNQLLYYIRQDFEKIPDRTTEDTNVLQAGKILEIHSALLKDIQQKEHKRQEALKELENALNQPPYFYSIQQILKFQDKNGRLLYGRYSEDDLKEFLQKKTTEGKTNELPPLLIFKVATGTRYYVYKSNVVQVIVRLCNEANISIERMIEDEWYRSLLKFDKLPEMTSVPEFEKKLRNLVETHSPVLYALLNANFMTLLSMEPGCSEAENIDNGVSFHIFDNGELLPYGELLMLYNNKIFANAKKRLPFFYSVPVISWIYRLIVIGNKKKNKEKEEVLIEENKPKTAKPVSKQEAIASKAGDIVKEMIPEGSTLDRELNYLIKQWNKMISKDAYNNLIEDVNSLVRDYTRRVVRTLSFKTFTRERVEGLAKTLVNTPNMRKITETKAITEYVILYMLRLLINIK